MGGTPVIAVGLEWFCPNCDAPNCYLHWHVTESGYGYCPVGHARCPPQDRRALRRAPENVSRRWPSRIGPLAGDETTVPGTSRDLAVARRPRQTATRSTCAEF